jgi:hypothetical protein
MVRKIICCLSLLLVLDVGYSFAKEDTADDSVSTKEFTQCTEPRPQMCTREYRPVCATLNDGTQKTYANGCTACSDPKVKGHFPGPCE